MLRALQLKGFQSHKLSRLEFVPGVNILIGDTNSGKSSIIRALYWLVNNRPSGQSFINGKECSVSIETDKGSVTRCRLPFNGYLVNDTKFTAIGTSVPSEVVEILNLSDINFQLQLAPHF